ncbi:MAG: hypothetical protein HY053_08140 [Proteobacteria bacterium]|nr:hypothetical protein [Pseudomonadota bacterium]
MTEGTRDWAKTMQHLVGMEAQVTHPGSSLLKGREGLIAEIRPSPNASDCVDVRFNDRRILAFMPERVGLNFADGRLAGAPSVKCRFTLRY